MNGVHVDAERRVAYVGGGAVWRDVDVQAMAYGLAAVGGTVNHVGGWLAVVYLYLPVSLTGVGGLTVGGGYGWLSERHGLAIDNLRQATVVTAHGSILTASETENADLFFGIRGGGSNFGVVTEFVFQLHPQRHTVFAGPVLYAFDAIEKLVEATRAWLPHIKPDEGLFQLATVDERGAPVMLLFFFYNGSEAEGRANFKAFLDIGPVTDGAKEVPYEEVNSMQNSTFPPGRCYYLQGVSQTAPDSASTVRVLRRCAAAVSSAPPPRSGSGSGPQLELAGSASGSSPDPDPLVPAVLYEYLPLAKINAVPMASTAFRRPLSHNILVMATWHDPDEPRRKNDSAREVVAEIFDGIIVPGQRACALSDSEEDTLGYANYDMDMPGEPAAAADKARQAFASNFVRLQEIKKKYDPGLFFNKWFPIPPAL